MVAVAVMVAVAATGLVVVAGSVVTGSVVAGFTAATAAGAAAGTLTGCGAVGAIRITGTPLIIVEYMEDIVLTLISMTVSVLNITVEQRATLVISFSRC